MPDRQIKVLPLHSGPRPDARRKPNDAQASSKQTMTPAGRPVGGHSASLRWWAGDASAHQVWLPPLDCAGTFDQLMPDLAPVEAWAVSMRSGASAAPSPSDGDPGYPTR